MKILILQDFPVNEPSEKFSIARGLERAFLRAGFHAHAESTPALSTSKEKIDCLFNQYDTLFIVQNYFLESIEYVKDFKGLKIFWSIDSHKDMERHKKFISENDIGISLVSNFNHVPKFNNAYWFPNCYPSDLIQPTEFKFRPIQVGFCGSRSNRGEYIDRLKSECGMHTAINICAENMVNNLLSYKIGWNRNESDDLNFRTFEMMGAGCLLLTNNTPGLNNLFELEHHLITYNSIEECIEWINFYKYYDNDRIRIAMEGYQEVRNNHSYDSRVAELVKIIETEKGNR